MLRRSLSAAALAVLLAAAPASARFHFAEIHEAMSGAGSDPTVQFVEIRMLAILQDLVAHSRLTAFNCDGTTATILLEVPGNVAMAGADVRWIMASPSMVGFNTVFGINPDFTFSGTIDPTCGNICWGAPGASVPENPPTWNAADVNNYVDCLAYGGYTGPKRLGQPVVAGPLGDGTQSQTRTTGTQTFNLTCPTPQNNAGNVGSLTGCTTTTTTTIVTTTSTSTSTTSTSTSTTTTTSLVPPQLIDGSKISLKDDPANAAKRKATVLSKDLDITLGDGNGSGDDPRTVGATVRIVSTVGDTFDNTYTLAAGASFWSLVGHEGENKGYKYKDSLLVNGPVKAFQVKPNKLIKITAKGNQLGHTLAANPDPVDVVVTMGTQHYCMRFAGTVTFKTPKTFSAKLAPAPGACAP